VSALTDSRMEPRAGGAVVSAGTAVRATVRRRRRRAVIATSSLAAIILVAMSAAAYADVDWGAPAPPIGAQPDAVDVGTAPPDARPAPQAGPNGRITRAQLLAATVNLPAWPRTSPTSTFCPDGRVRLTPKKGADGRYEFKLDKVAYANIDADASAETLAVVRCERQDTGDDQLLAFDRNGSGKIVLVGQVIHTSRDTDTGWLANVRPGAGSTVQVEVLDLRPGPGTAEAWSQRQWRTFGRTGKTFSQTAGPRAFPPNPNFVDLELKAATKLVYGPPADARQQRFGRMTVTVKNNGPTDADAVRISWEINQYEVWRNGAAWSGCARTGWQRHGAAGVGTTSVWCDLGKLTAGEQRRITIGFHVFSEVKPAHGAVSINRTPRGGVPVPWDADADDNYKVFPIGTSN